MALSLDRFAAQLSESGVLPEPEVTALRTEHAPADAEQFARLLVKRKVLTAYQAQQAFAGRAKALVLGNYLILDKLGQGGMGMVLKARHRRMDRLVALKVLSPTVVKTPDLLARFHREVKAAARLEHANIVSAYDADEANGTHFFVMQYVEGTDLSALVKTKGILPVDQAVNCVLQAARGLEYAHKHGVIHRDIKPANLLLDTMGNVKVLDMGLARIEGDTGSQADLTSTGAVMGTVDYMAPEQALDTKSADARSDIYSLGITLWYLLIGRPVYEGNSLMSRLLAHRESPIPSLKGTRGEVPPALDALFQKMLAKQSAQRCQSMTEVVAALENCQRAGTAGASSAVPSFAAGPSEDSKLSEMIALFGVDTDPAAATRTMVQTGKATVTARKTRDTAYDATITAAHPETETDPATLTSLKRTKGGPRKKKPEWWQDQRVLFGGIAASVLLGVIVITITRKDGSQTTVTAPGDAQAVEVKQNGETLVKVENTPPKPTVSPNVVVPSSKALYPTSPADLPAGFVRLFNGTDLTGWKGAVLDPKQRAAMSPSDLSAAQAKADESMRAHWSVVGGVLSFDGKGDNLSTARDYRDFEFYLEWKITTGGDTGIHLRGSPQIQIWDSVTKANAANVGSGGLYNNQKHPSRPLVNADKPVGEWNAMLIRMVGEKVTVSLNGRLVVDDVVMENYVERDKPIYPTGPIELQKFGTPLQFRNLLIRELNSNTTPPEVSTPSNEWTSLFDGKTLNGWESVGEGGWSAAEGVLKAAGTGKGWIGTTRTFRDYELELEYRIQSQGNGGIALRAWREGGISAIPFFEVQILDDTANPDINPTGSITGHVRPKPGFKAPLGEWNRITVRLEGKHALVTVNGTTTVDADLPIERDEGMIGLQVWGRPVEYRNIRVREVGRTQTNGPARSTAPFVALFDGRTLAGWQGVGSATIPADWKVEDGAILAPGTKSSIATRADFGDMELDLDWKVAPGANGGVFYGWQGETAPSGTDGLLILAPEYQMVDNVGHPNGKKPETSAGSLFNFYAPSTDATRPAGEWNQARIVVRGAEVEHWLNGQRVVAYTVGTDDFTAHVKNSPRRATLAALQRIGPGKIVLQSNGGVVHYRNLRVRTQPAPAVAPFDAAQARTHQEAWARHLGVPVEYKNTLGMEFVLIPPGAFTMGSTPAEIAASLTLPRMSLQFKESVQGEGPLHQVVLTRPFYLGRHEVTQSQYERIMGRNPSAHTATSSGKARVSGLDTSMHPVEMVTFQNVTDFCSRLNRVESRPSLPKAGEESSNLLDVSGYRLPTEAEWEFACRAGTTTGFGFGDRNEDLEQYGWFVQNSKDRTHAVGELKPNPFGLHDVHGNVYEWVQDRWEPRYFEQFSKAAAVDPLGPLQGAGPNPNHVTRGGSWANAPPHCRSSSRHAFDRVSHNFGFRVALAVGGTVPANPSGVAGSPSTSGRPAPGGAGASEVIDLLAPTDFEIKNEPAFSWRRAGTNLVGTSLGPAGDGKWAGLKFSPPVAGDYDLEIDFKQRGSSYFQIDLPLGDRAVRTSLTDQSGYLIWIDGRDWTQLGPPHRMSGKMLREDEPQRFLARVRNRNQGKEVTIEVTLDGQPVASFVGARTQLSIPDPHPHDKHLVQFQAQPLDASRFSMEISRAIVRIAKPLASPAPTP